jgi:hypothetical protein
MNSPATRFDSLNPTQSNAMKKPSRRSTRLAREAPTAPPVPRLPHERDESADSQASKPRKRMQQAAADLERGLVDTSRAGIQGVDEREATEKKTRHTAAHKPRSQT